MPSTTPGAPTGARTAALVASLALVALVVMLPAASAEILRFSVHMLRPEPSVESPGGGFAFMRIDMSTKVMRVTVPFTGLTSPPTMAHIHAPTTTPGSGNAGVIIPFTNFPIESRDNAYLDTIDLSDPASYGADFLAANGGSTDAAFSAFLDAMYANKAYVNIHTLNFPSGEIRGFLVPYEVSEGGNLYTDEENVVISVEPSSAVYTDTLYVNGGVNSNPEEGGPVITNKLAPGTTFDLGAGAKELDIAFNIRIAFPGVEPYTLSSIKEENDDGQPYARISQLSANTFRIAFEDRLDGQPDRPEAPTAPKDFNDLVFTASGVFFYDVINLIEDRFTPNTVTPNTDNAVATVSAASIRSTSRAASINGVSRASVSSVSMRADVAANVGVGGSEHLAAGIPQAWKDLIAKLMLAA